MVVVVLLHQVYIPCSQCLNSAKLRSLSVVGRPIADAKGHGCPGNDPLAPVAADHRVSVCQSATFWLTCERKQLVQQQGGSCSDRGGGGASQFVRAFHCSVLNAAKFSSISSCRGEFVCVVQPV